MSFKAIKWAMEQKLPAMQKIVLLVLADYTNDDDSKCFPSHETLVDKCGMAKRSVINQLDELEKSGFITIIRGKKGSREGNKYLLNLNSITGALNAHDKTLQVQEMHLSGAGDALVQVQEMHSNLLIEPINEPVLLCIKDEAKKSEKNSALKWVEYFVNKHGFSIHEAQTAKTVPMFIRWNENNVTVDDVELAILAAHGWLSKKGESKATSPALYDKFLKTVLAEKQQAQKNPLDCPQAGLILVTNNTNKDYSNDYFSKYNPPKQRPSTADRQLYSCYRGDIKDDYDAGLISYETYREGMRRYATN